MALLDKNKEYINEGNITQKTPLHLSIERNHVEAAKTLVSFGASMNLMDQSGNTAFSLNFQLKEPIFKAEAVQNYVPESPSKIIKTFTKPPKTPTKELPIMHSSPLHHAIVTNKWSTVISLLKSGADMAAEDSDWIGRSAFSLALERKVPLEGTKNKINKTLIF